MEVRPRAAQWVLTYEGIDMLPKDNNPKLEPTFYCQLCGRIRHIEHMDYWQPYHHGPTLDVCKDCMEDLPLPSGYPYPVKIGPVLDRAKADDVDGMVYLMARYLAETGRDPVIANEFICEGVEVTHGQSTLVRWFTKGGQLQTSKLSKDFNLYTEVQ